jgi:hypothetical protein
MQWTLSTACGLVLVFQKIIDDRLNHDAGLFPVLMEGVLVQ